MPSELVRGVQNRTFFGGDLTLTFTLQLGRVYCTRGAIRDTLPECIKASLIDACTCEGCGVTQNPVDYCSECNKCQDCCDCWTCDCGRRSHTCEAGTDRCSSCELCMDHCECSECDNCGRRGHSDSLYICSECEQCEGHCCECSSCEGCGYRGTEVNRNGHCPSCRGDDEECKVERFVSRLTFHACSKTEHKRNPSKRHISCELEIADVSDDCGISSAVRRHKGCIVEDGSLPDTGFEINTAPAAGDVFCDQIDDICAALVESDATVDSSCGYHVHVDARDFRFFEIRKLVILYARIEDALFAMTPKSRHGSSYCIPCGKRYLRDLKPGKLCKKSVVETVYGTSGRVVREYRGSKYQSARYAALNLHSWFYRGTIECRMAAGTINANKVACWGMLWAGILDYVYKTPEKDVQALVDRNLLGLEVLLSVCPTDEVREFVKERTAKFGR